jgi:hypothetical protein
MANNKVKRIVSKLFLIVFLVSLMTIGCEKNMVSQQEENLEFSTAATKGLVGSWQTIHALNSAKDISKFVHNQSPVSRKEVGGLYDIAQIAVEIDKFEEKVPMFSKSENISPVRGDDSLLWFIDWKDPINKTSVRKALYYDRLTGRVRYYETMYQFPVHLQLRYDSTEIRADLNYTLIDSTDDKILSIFKLTEYRENFDVIKTESNVIVTDYDEQNEVTGAVMENLVWYSERCELEKLTQNLEINPDESGSILERLDYQDGTYRRSVVNFYNNFTGDFSEIWRDGTRVDGTFDRLEDDNHANFSKTIIYPSGNDPLKIYQFGDVTFNPSDFSSRIILKERIYFLAGQVDTSQVIVEEQFDGEIKHTHLVIDKSDGFHADLKSEKYKEYEEIEGILINTGGYYTILGATLYNDGSGDVHLEVYASEEDYQNGEPALVLIDIHFNSDGTGDGLVAENSKKYNVKINSDGKMIVSDQQGHHQSLNGF